MFWKGHHFLFHSHCQTIRTSSDMELYVLLSFFVWSLCCLPFNLRLLITPLVCSNFSYCLHGNSFSLCKNLQYCPLDYIYWKYSSIFDIKVYSNLYSKRYVKTTTRSRQRQPLLNIRCQFIPYNIVNKGNNKITEIRTILQRESQNS
jgi:hypothetical protein